MTTNDASLLRAAAAASVLLLATLLTLLLARAAMAAPPLTAGGWQLPLPGSPAVLRPFDPPAEKWGAGHRGIDLAAAVGTDVFAAGSGVVAFAGRVAGRGVVSIKHGELRTTYQPVRSVVRAGQTIATGQVIGTVLADPHCRPRSCLHWGLLEGDRYLDPMTLLRAGAPRLLPIWGISPGAPATADPTSSPTWHKAGQPNHRRTAPTSSRPASSADTQRPSPVPGAAIGVLTAAAGATGFSLTLARRRRAPRPGVEEPP